VSFTFPDGEVKFLGKRFEEIQIIEELSRDEHFGASKKNYFWAGT